jgi:hypothetical protein
VPSRKRFGRRSSADGGSAVTETKRPPKFVRAWHRRDADYCHLWDMDEAHYRLWRENKAPLKAPCIFLPDGTQPEPGKQVRCGTCKTSRFSLSDTKFEFMRD